MTETTRPNVKHRLHIAGYTFPPAEYEDGSHAHDAFNDQPLYAVPGRVFSTETGIRRALINHLGTVPQSKYEELK